MTSILPPIFAVYGCGTISNAPGPASNPPAVCVARRHEFYDACVEAPPTMEFKTIATTQARLHLSPQAAGG
jgi:hypothetical protein